MKKIAELINFRIKLTFIFALIFGSTTFLFNFLVFSYVIDALKSDFDDALYNYCVDVSESLDGKFLNSKFEVNPALFEHGKILPFSLGTSAILVRKKDSSIITHIGNLGSFTPPFNSEIAKIANGADAAYRTLNELKDFPDPESNSYRLITFPLENINPQFFLQVIVPRTLLETQIENRIQVFQFGIPLLIFISMLIGYFISGRALAPVKNIIEATKRINASSLFARVPVPKTKDEFKELAIVLNQALEKIEKSFESQEKFIADASHQLLSPLTIMKSEIELFQKNNTSSTEITHFLQNQHTEIDNLAQIVQDMLLLARMDAGISHFNLSEIHVDEVLLECISRLEKKAVQKNIKIHFHIFENHFSNPLVLADPDLLKHLFHNLIENAIKYSPVNSNINIHLSWNFESTVVDIIDHGPGIPEDQISLIFERFSRAPQNQKIQGFGLGLAIAKKIANLLNSKLKVSNFSQGDQKGCTFTFEIKNI